MCLIGGAGFEPATPAVLERRTSVIHFDTQRSLEEEQIVELVLLATPNPSAYNLQRWKFFAVRDAAAKERLKAAAYGQQKIVDAPVTFIVFGTLNAPRRRARVLQPSLDSGVLTADVVADWVSMAQGSHEGNPQLPRDDALRSASLAGHDTDAGSPGPGAGHRSHERFRSGRGAARVRAASRRGACDAGNGWMSRCKEVAA